MLRTTLILGLSFTLFAAGADAQTQGRRLQDIVLDSGVTLADWVRVTRSREPSPSLATGAQAAQFVRQHGAHRELLDIVWRATQNKGLQRESIARENAAERLVALTEARRQLGDWPSLLMASAAARSYLGDASGATADLRRWMTLAPVSDPSREQVTEVLLSVAQKPDAVVIWLTQSGIGLIPLEMRRPVEPYFAQFSKEMERALKCLGHPAQYDDLAVMLEGKSRHDGSPYSWQLTYLATKVGLPSRKLAFDSAIWKDPSNQEIASPAGAYWLREKSRLEGHFESEKLHKTTRHECSAPLLPAAKGKKVDFLSEVETSYHERHNSKGLTTSIHLFRWRLTIEFLSDAIAMEELVRAYPGVRLRLPTDYRGRFYLVRWRTESEDVSPPKPGQTPIPSESREEEGVFVEGPNALVGLGSAAVAFLMPGTTWTLTRP